MRLCALWFPLAVTPALATTAVAETRRIPFWPDAVPAAIQKHVDGAYVHDAVRSLGQFHRVHGSPQFHAAAEWLVGQLTAAGLTDAAIDPLPADGTTSYAHFKSYLGWNPVEGRLAEASPTRRTLGDFPRDATALADYSQDADVTTELIDVGAGASAAAYQGKDVRGKIV